MAKAMLDMDILLKAAAAATVTLLVQWLLKPVAYRLKLLDYPSGRKDHAHPTPVTGGLAMAIGIMAVAWATMDTLDDAFLAYMLGGALLIGVGVLDDKHDLPWWLRISVQACAALLMATLGGVRVEHLGPVFGLGDASLGALSLPFTVFATVGLINAVNMVDGADGMAGSLVLTALLMLSAAALYSGNHLVAERAMTFAGAVAAFLWFNLRFPWRPRAQVFMGNAGSAFLGFTIAWVSFRLTQNPGHPVSPVLALWLIPVPVADCLVLMVRRMRTGHSPFHADQTHVHHVLRGSGYSPMQKAFFLCVFSAICGLVAGEAMRLDVPHVVLLLAFFALCVGWYWLSSRRDRAVRFFTRLREFGVLPRLRKAQATDLSRDGNVVTEKRPR